MEIFILAGWHIWKQHNDLVFDREVPMIRRWYNSLKQEVLSQTVGYKEVVRPVLLDCFALVDSVT